MTEHQHQTNLMSWAALQSGAWPELQMLYAIPNGGHRHKAVAAKLKAEGVKSGVPDLCLPVPRGPYHGLYIEMKTEKGRASKKQAWWLARLEAYGYKAELCHGWFDARNEIINYLEMEEYA